MLLLLLLLPFLGVDDGDGVITSGEKEEEDEDDPVSDVSIMFILNVD
jgi:hypothetical protein